MKRALESLGVVVVFCLLLLLACPCSVEWNKERALTALRIVETKTLLLAMEKYQSKVGRLPNGLKELQQGDAEMPEIRKIDLTHYTYDPEGFVLADWTRRIQMDDPYRKGQLIVGRLPVEVDYKKK